MAGEGMAETEEIGEEKRPFPRATDRSTGEMLSGDTLTITNAMEVASEMATNTQEKFDVSAHRQYARRGA